jgi:hypothetical protein
LQILDVVYDLDILEFLNVSWPGESIVSELRRRVQIDWFEEILYASWKIDFKVPFSLILTKWGFCHNFNMMEASSLLNFDK